MLVDHFNTLVRRVPTAALYILCALPAPWLFYVGATGGLGAEPIKALERELGEIALQLLIIGLTITPLRRFLGVNLRKFRRAFGPFLCRAAPDGLVFPRFADRRADLGRHYKASLCDIWHGGILFDDSAGCHVE